MENETRRAEGLGEALSDGLVLAGDQCCCHHARCSLRSDGWASQYRQRVGFSFFLEAGVNGFGNQLLTWRQPFGQIQQDMAGLEVREYILHHVQNHR